MDNDFISNIGVKNIVSPVPGLIGKPVQTFDMYCNKLESVYASNLHVIMFANMDT